MLPLVERELRTALRRDARRHRLNIALGCAGIAALFLMLVPGAAGLSAMMFRVLLWIGLYTAVVRTLQQTADLFSQERRNDTWSLLFLAGLGPWEVFAGKLFGAATLVIYNLLGILPFLALSFFGGSVSLEAFLAAITMLPNLLLFTFALSVLASTLCKDDGAALWLASVGGAMICGLPLAVWYANWTVSGTTADAVLTMSPAFGAYLVYQLLPPARVPMFWINSGVTLLYSLLALMLAAVVLKRTWRQNPDRTQTRWSATIARFCFGTPEWRSAMRTRWLDRNAFIWLALRERYAVVGATAVMWMIALGWSLGLVLWPKAWLTPVTALITALLINLTLAGGVVFAASRRFAEDRRSGAMELLLTTPLSLAEIIEGYHSAVRAQFRPLLRCTVGANVALMLITLIGRRWNVFALAALALSWMLLWSVSIYPMFSAMTTAMWGSLNSARPTYTALKTFSMDWPLFWCGCLLFAGRFSIASFPRGTVSELVLLGFIGVITLIVLGRTSADPSAHRIKLLSEFREIAATPIPSPSDPRFKKWKVTDSFSPRPLPTPLPRNLPLRAPPAYLKWFRLAGKIWARMSWRF